MSRTGNGTYVAPSSSWNPAINGVTAAYADWNALLTDIAAALTQSVSKDGQTTMTGNLPMGGFVLTGLGAGAATGQSLRWQQLFSQGVQVDIASASTVDIGAENTNFLNITGTTTITSFGTNYNGPRFLRFDGALTLTHNATTLILPGGANITTAAGDTCIAVPNASTSGTSDGWLVLSYQRASQGMPAFRAYRSTSQSISNATFTTVVCATEDYDTSSAYDTSTGIFTCPTGWDGYYSFCGQVNMTAVTTGDMVLELRKNGARCAVVAVDASSIGTSLNVSVQLSLVATDTVDMRVYQNTGSSQNVTTGTGETFFSGAMLRRASRV